MLTLRCKCGRDDDEFCQSEEECSEMRFFFSSTQKQRQKFTEEYLNGESFFDPKARATLILPKGTN